MYKLHKTEIFDFKTGYCLARIVVSSRLLELANSDKNVREREKRKKDLRTARVFAFAFDSQYIVINVQFLFLSYQRVPI